MELASQPYPGPRLGDWLTTNLVNDEWTSFQLAVAFSHSSGVKYIFNSLGRFAERATVEMVLGIDSQGTSYEALHLIMDALCNNGRAWIFHNEGRHLFHPKVYAFSNQQRAKVAIGSSNLTKAGLYTNYEASALLSLDLGHATDNSAFEALQDFFRALKEPVLAISRPLTRDLIEDLLAKQYILREEVIRRSSALQRRRAPSARLFGSQPLPVPPAAASTIADLGQEPEDVVGFLMTLQNTDVGAGQVTPGTSRRSPEIFLPVVAVRDVAPEFWGWPHKFSGDPQNPDKKDRRLKIRLGGDTIPATVWRNPKKNDFRLRAEAIRSAGKIGDILRVEIAPDEADYDYYVEIVPRGSRLYEEFDSLCDHKVQGRSPKRFGYYYS